MSGSFTFGGIFWGAAFVAALGCALWWFIRRRRREMRMPILRILDLPQTKLPKVVIRTPPLVPFLAFAAAAAAFALWSTQPKNKEFANHEPRQLRVHVFVDMSPSLSAHGTVGELARAVSSLWSDLRNVSRVTLSTSHGDTIYDVQDGSKVESIIQAQGFHRSGTQIGAAVKRHLLATGEIDRLIIVSDRDLHSWSGFQWRYLSDETEVFWLSLDQLDEQIGKPNAFINAVRIVNAPGAAVAEWDVDIAQGGVARAQEGTLQARYRGDILGSTNWKISDGHRAVTVKLSWPSRPLAVRASSVTASPEEDEPIVWEITPDGADAIAMDNEFRTSQTGRGGVVKIVAELSGEMPLEDPGVALQTVLRVMGLSVERVDMVSQLALTNRESQSQKTQGLSADLWIVLGGLGRGVDTFCPKTDPKRIWIVPWSQSADYGELCKCALRIRKNINSSCDDVGTRDSWISWLMANGGKQVGGTLGEVRESVAFALSPSSDSGISREVLGMTIPLRPSQAFGISYGQFPILIRQVFHWQTLNSREHVQSDLADWPRFADVSKGELKPDTKVFGAKTNVTLSNVPLGESLLTTQALSELPKVWDSANRVLAGPGPGKLDSEDPLPWIRTIVYVVLGLCAFELLWMVRRKRKTLVSASVLALCFMTLAPASEAQVPIDFFRVPGGASMDFSRLSREVSARTSIEMPARAEVFESLSQRALDQPWLWIRSPEGVTDKSGGMSPALVRWLKRGGFMVIESNGTDDSQWDRFAAPLSSGSFRPLGWNPVPQDHELMRSFYLLATLPSCKGQLWRWYGIDGRIAMLQVPYHFSAALQDQPARSTCEAVNQSEIQIRVFVNVLMVALTTDYKRDQIHLPEILKRLRVP